MGGERERWRVDGDGEQQRQGAAKRPRRKHTNTEDTENSKDTEDSEDSEVGPSLRRFLKGCEDNSKAVGSGFGAEARQRRRQRQRRTTAAAAAATASAAAHSLGARSADSGSRLLSAPPLGPLSGLSVGANPNNPTTTTSSSWRGRASSIVQTALLLSALVQERRRVLAFCQSRKLVELVSLPPHMLSYIAAIPHHPLRSIFPAVNVIYLCCTVIPMYIPMYCTVLLARCCSTPRGTSSRRRDQTCRAPLQGKALRLLL